MAGIEGLLVGRELGGRYRVEEVIGRGGMGAVYRAVDERLGRQVAIKVITVAGSGEAESRERLRARFFREARSAAALPHHPNVVPVYDYGSDEALGLDYIVMELLRGSDLASRLSRSGAPPLAAALKILLEAARGLAVGHNQGLIHRDVKPGNIFLAETQSKEVQVRVVDFGIAKLTDEEDTLAQLTQDGRVPHSPAYASPEQLRGLTQLTSASDVFSLGAVGFQLLTGERPFTESDRNRMSLGMPVDVPSVRTRNPAVPSSADAVIQRALAFDPEQRFVDAGAMAVALERAIRTMADSAIDPYLAGAPIVTAAEGDRETQALSDDDRTQLADVEDDRTLLAPSPLPGGGERSSIPHRTAGREPLPPRPQERPKRRGVGGIIVWGLVLALLAAAGLWGWSEMQGGGGVAMEEIPPPPADSVPFVGPEPEIFEPEPGPLDANINNREGVRYFNAGSYDSARVQFQRAVQIEPDNPDYRRNYALALLALGLDVEAEREVDRAIQLNPNLANAWITRADAQLSQGDTVSAIESIEEYLARGSNPRELGIAERRLRDLRAAQGRSTVPLLGDTVGVPNRTPAPPPAPDAQPATPPDAGAGDAANPDGQTPPPAAGTGDPAQPDTASAPQAALPGRR